MEEKIQDFKASGLKVTLPRLKILEIFHKNQDRHLSAEDVYKILVKENVEVGLATVYRVLTQFEQAGLLRRNFFETGKAIYELNEGEHHDHIICVDCGHVEEFHDQALEDLKNKIAETRGYALLDHSLVLHVSCQRKKCPNREK